MLKKTLQKIISNPFAYTKLLFFKTVVYPFKYKKGQNDYDAERYWRDRFVSHGLELRGPGDEGDSERNNLKRYKRVTSILKEELTSKIPDFKNLKVLEIGTGTGLITNALKELGVVNYIGVDITDVLFNDLQKTYLGYQFKKIDVTKDLINDKFDLIVIIDVIEHIVENGKFNFAMNNLKNSLKEHGSIIIAPIVRKNYKSQFYERHWTINNLRESLTEFEYSEPKEWEKGFSQIYMLCKL
jgi:2-polyprenyl-3-methyl-5-hydroxy-6-metoxy-1,4-benzoquinol methylase